jgi:PST family polysaccharide transporter
MIKRIFGSKVSANLGWLFWNNLVIQTVGFTVGVQVIKYLGPADYGLLVYATILTAFFSVGAALGLELVSVKLLVSKPDQSDAILGSVFFLRLLSSTAAFVLLLSFVSFFDRGNRGVILLVALFGLTLFTQVFCVIDYFFQANLWSKYTVWSQNVAMAVCSLARIGGIAAKAPVVFFVGMTLLEAVLTAACLIIFYRRRGLQLKRWRIDFSLVRELIRVGGWIFVYDLAVILQMQLDKVFIRKMLSFRDVGIYSAAASLTALWFFLPTIIGASIFPSLVRKNAQLRDDYHSHLQSGFSLMTLIGLVICIAVSLGSEGIVRFLFGAEYAGGGKIATVMIWSILFVFHVSMRSKAMIIDRQWAALALYAVLALGINSALNFVLISRYGITGGAWAYLLTWVSAVLLCPLLSKKTAGYAVMFWKSFDMLRNIRKVKFE